METCDVLIAGAGPAGSVTAKLIADAGFKVILLERSEFDTFRPGESLSPAVKTLLQDLKLWDPFVELHPFPSYGTRYVWGNAMPEMHTHLFTAHGTGWHVERLALDHMLALEAVKAGAQLFKGCRLLNADYENGGNFRVRVAGKNNEFTLQAKFLVDASGRKAFLSTQMDAERIVFDRLVGIAAQFDDKDTNGHLYTMVEATADGWWYSAPLNTNTSVVMLMTDGDLAVKKHMHELDIWLQALMETDLTAAHFKGRKIKCGTSTFSAVSQRVIKSSSDERPWLNVGDAALSVDPVSGSGVIRALTTAKEAASCAIATLRADNSLLSVYEENRNTECHKYLKELGAYYRLERRWPHAVFWKRRRAILQNYLQE